jgi:hypothetical protein
MPFVKGIQTTRTNMSFLPSNYVAPKSSSESYAKLQPGENRFRILSASIQGWEDWDNKKPIRYKYDEKPLTSIDPKMPVKHFWAMIVWNYNEEKIQILELTQATIRKALEKLCKDADWGEPYFYDIKISKEGEQKNTEYSISPLPHKQASDRIMDEYAANPCFLEALFTGEDPFDSKWRNTTQGIFIKADIKAPSPDIKRPSDRQIIEMNDLLASSNKPFRDSIWEALHKSNITKLEELSVDYYERILKAVRKELAKNPVEQPVNDLPF